MLNALRRGATGWVAKGLFVLILLSFVGWGAGDSVFGPRVATTVAEVGDAEIARTQLEEEFQATLSRLQAGSNQTITREQAVSFGLLDRTLQSLIGRGLLDQGARELGLAVDDATVRDAIVADPTFRGPAGGFDRQRFESLLSLNGLTEAGYVEGLRGDMLRRHLIEGVTGAVTAPATLVETLFRHRNERRDGRALVVRADAVTNVPAPTEKQLADFHAANAARYTAPEFRDVGVIALDAGILAGTISVPEDRLRAVYRERIAGFSVPERRDVVQFLASDEAVIREAERRLRAGEPGEAVAGTLQGRGLERTVRADVTDRTVLPNELKAAIFTQEPGAVGRPVRSLFGWYLFRVTNVEPPSVRPFAAVRRDLAAEIAREEAAERLPDVGNELEDELAAGSTLREAADSLKLPLRRVPALSAAGRTPEGAVPEGLPAWPEIPRVAFATPEGEPTLLEQAEGGGSFVLQVNAIRPARLKPLAEVRGEVEADWRAERRREMAEALAERLAKRAAGGAPLDALKAEVGAGAEIRPIAGVKRDAPGAAARVGRDAVAALFQTPPGEAAGAAVPAPDGFAVVATDRVLPADPKADPAAVRALQDELNQAVRADVLAQYEDHLRRRFPVEVDEQALASVVQGYGEAPASSSF